jgi:hypothetical protein
MAWAVEAGHQNSVEKNRSRESTETELNNRDHRSESQFENFPALSGTF